MVVDGLYMFAPYQKWIFREFLTPFCRFIFSWFATTSMKKIKGGGSGGMGGRGPAGNGNNAQDGKEK